MIQEESNRDDEQVFALLKSEWPWILHSDTQLIWRMLNEWSAHSNDFWNEYFLNFEQL